MHLLVVEDDPVLGDAITRSLRESGYAVDWVRDGLDADRILDGAECDLVVLDLGLPQLDGIEVLRRLRARKSRLPVLVLTARGAVHHRIHALDLGADDYLTKPFQIGELSARIRALLRRAQGQADSRIEVARLTVDLRARRAFVGEVALRLSAREFGFLELLAANAGRVVNKETLIRSLYSLDKDVGPNAIDIYLHRLRRKLRDSGAGIQTVRGLGYVLEAGEATPGGPPDAR
jgi:two-component system OmpR family response regulator